MKRLSRKLRATTNKEFLILLCFPEQLGPYHTNYLLHLTSSLSPQLGALFFFAIHFPVYLVPVFCCGKHELYTSLFFETFTLEIFHFASILLSSGSVLFVARKFFLFHQPCYISNFSSTNLHTSSIACILDSFRFLYLNSSSYHRFLIRLRAVCDPCLSANSQAHSPFSLLL